MARFERIERLRRDNPDIPLKAICQRVGLSCSWYWKIKRSLSFQGRSFAAHEALSERHDVLKG
jgi:hypothetical protein